MTAAAGGIGGELVMLLLEAGAACSRATSAASGSRRSRSAPASRRDRLSVLKVDVADEKGASHAGHAAIERSGTVHGLANIAGGIAGIGEDIIDRPIDRITRRGIPADRAPQPGQRVLHDARTGAALSRASTTARS